MRIMCILQMTFSGHKTIKIEWFYIVEHQRCFLKSGRSPRNPCSVYDVIEALQHDTPTPLRKPSMEIIEEQIVHQFSFR